MTTGACGIDCTVCLLHVRGVCSTCGAGTSHAGREKLAAQRRLFNAACPILECAVEREIDHCLRDCEEFPCERFARGPYPFSQGYLDMHTRRRKDVTENQAHWPESAPEFWDALEARPDEEVCGCSGARLEAPNRYRLAILNEAWVVDAAERRVVKAEGTFGGEWDRQIPFLALAYLTAATDADLTGDLVPPRDLVAGQDSFQGHNTIETSDLEKAFGSSPGALPAAGAQLGARQTGQADVSVRLDVFPKLPVEILLWLADEEFPARVTILLDRGTPGHYPVEGIANVVNLLTRRLLLAARQEKR
jgi:hypothetical protein